MASFADACIGQALSGRYRHELSWRAKMLLFRDVVAGIHQMHCRRIMHRDLKASNVLLFDAKRPLIALTSGSGGQLASTVSLLSKKTDSSLRQTPRLPASSCR